MCVIISPVPSQRASITGSDLSYHRRIVCGPEIAKIQLACESDHEMGAAGGLRDRRFHRPPEIGRRGSLRLAVRHHGPAGPAHRLPDPVDLGLVGTRKDPLGEDPADVLIGDRIADRVTGPDGEHADDVGEFGLGELGSQEGRGE